jgi:hypothetical protein
VVRSGAAGERVVAVIDFDAVIVIAAEQAVAAAAAEDIVVAIAAVGQCISSPGVKEVVACAAVERVPGRTSAPETVIAGLAVKGTLPYSPSMSSSPSKP